MFNSRGTGVQSGLVALAIVVTAGARIRTGCETPWRQRADPVNRRTNDRDEED